MTKVLMYTVITRDLSDEQEQAFHREYVMHVMSSYADENILTAKNRVQQEPQIGCVRCHTSHCLDL